MSSSYNCILLFRTHTKFQIHEIYFKDSLTHNKLLSFLISCSHLSHSSTKIHVQKKFMSQMIHVQVAGTHI